MMIGTLIAALQLLPPEVIIALAVLGLIAAAFAIVLLFPEDEFTLRPEDVIDSHTEDDP